jgi:hypothetical protein
MNINDVINDLVKELQPVRPVRPFSVRYATWAAAVFAAVGALLLAISARRDPDIVFDSARLVSDAVMVVLIALTASWSALKLSVPGEEKPFSHRYMPLALLAMWCLFSVFQVAVEAIHTGAEALVPDPHVVCALLVAGAGGLLMIPLTFLLRGAAPLDPRWCGAMAGIAAGAAAMIGIEFICVYERPAHFMAYHVLPVLLFGVAGALAGPRLLPWRGAK